MGADAQEQKPGGQEQDHRSCGVCEEKDRRIVDFQDRIRHELQISAALKHQVDELMEKIAEQL